MSYFEKFNFNLSIIFTGSLFPSSSVSKKKPNLSMSLKSALSILRDQKDRLMIAAQYRLIIPCRFAAAHVYYRFRRHHRTSSPIEIDWSQEHPKKDFMTKPYSEWTNKDKTECFMARYKRFGTGGL
ncbi:unnamed protein product [Trifolium pratense]|uniref:Uncharacterized protein n=1 Tax=Trifolium pratense TaxID=57577 RepID=A0ACB0IEG4_TRIPR|nr:unnamed protein product [Trifolium pratense]